MSADGLETKMAESDVNLEKEASQGRNWEKFKLPPFMVEELMVATPKQEVVSKRPF